MILSIFIALALIITPVTSNEDIMLDRLNKNV